MDPQLQAVYDRLQARERDTREKIIRTYPSFVATGVPGRFGKAIRANVVRSCWRHERIFSIRHAGHYYFPAFQFSNGAPKPLVRRLLKLVKPDYGWHAMYWLSGRIAGWKIVPQWNYWIPSRWKSCKRRSMPMTASATRRELFDSLLEDVREARSVAPEKFASLMVYDLRELEERAQVPVRTAEIEPRTPQLQAYMGRSLRVVEALIGMELDFPRPVCCSAASKTGLLTSIARGSLVAHTAGRL